MSARRPIFARPRPVALALGLAIAFISVVGAAASAGAPKPETSTVSASIAYIDGSKSKVPVWKNVKITIKYESKVMVDAELLPEGARESVFAAPKLVAVDLDDDGEAEVVVDVFTAGVDCCRRSVIYRRDGNAYRTQILTWADSGYRLDDVIGESSPEFLASDSRFPRAWDTDARGPLRIFALRGDRVRDVSRRAPRQLVRDARIHLRAWRSLRRKKEGGDARPIVAAYVADLVRLGQIDEARDALRNASNADELRTSRKAFTRSLDRKLVAWGYTSRRVLSQRAR